MSTLIVCSITNNEKLRLFTLSFRQLPQWFTFLRHGGRVSGLGRRGRGCEGDSPKPPDNPFQVTRVLHNHTSGNCTVLLTVGLCLSLDQSFPDRHQEAAWPLRNPPSFPLEPRLHSPNMFLDPSLPSPHLCTHITS